LLSNIYLLDFDTKISRLVARCGGLYRRYCDDLLIVLPTARQRTKVLRIVQERLRRLGLPIHPTKTELTDFVKNGDRLTTHKPLNYLGFTFDGRNKRLRPASIARFYKKMRAGVGRMRAIRFRAQKSSTPEERAPLRRRKLHILYSYLGRHNFLSYAFDAARIMKDLGIKRQVKAHWKRLQHLIHH
jgi:hypothetical protein